jgi:LPXTG-motif cell wall-anchored protein
MAVPVGVNVGDDCPFIGSYTAFDDGKIRAACPTRDAYLAAVRRAVEANVAEGSLLAPEGARYLAEAEALDVWGDVATSGAPATSCALRATPPPSTTPAAASAPGGALGAEADDPVLPATGSSSQAGLAAVVLVVALAAGGLRRRSEPVRVSAPRGAETLPHC